MSLCDMVLQKRLDYGSSGYQVPAMPHVPRSAKGKRSVRKRVEINQMCAFDLLATVAGKLLETENFGAPFSTDGLPNHTTAKDSIMQEQLVKGKSHETDVFDHINCNISTLGSDAFFHRQGSYAAKDRLQTSNTSSGHSSVFVKTDTSVEDVFVGKSIISGIRSEVGPSLGTIPEKHSVDRRSPDSVESCKYKTEECIKTPLRAERRMPANEINGNVSRIRGREDPMDMDVKPPALVSSDSSVEIPPCADHIANSSIPRRGKHIGNALGRDDDENSSGCTHPSAVPSKAFKPQHIGDRRIRNLLVSKYWKVAPTMLKDGESSDTEIKPVYRGRKMCYTRQRTQRSSFKRRKIFEHCTVPTTDGGIHSEGTSNSPVKGGIKLEAIDSHATLHGGSGASSSSTGQKSSYESEDLHVKFSIKSFKVPELFIEIPETATVGSLKTTVMEAVTAILGGGLRVGVLLQGKKIRDDSKTLAQAGLSHDDKLENLGFTLEPNPTRAPQLLPSPEDFLTLCDTTEQLTRVPDMVPHLDQGASSATLQVPLTTVANGLESDYDSAHSPTDVSSLDKTTADSKALIPLPTVSAEALAVVPFHKSRRSELAQRRIRRPFSVAEVEALVQAVEKLGTGRWRDVKLRAFDNAKHRTYVDLKDKWKTLVHTARITPQQRRGEPVPQELLDRVLAAHAYWAQQQAKLQAKPPPAAEACLLF